MKLIVGLGNPGPEYAWTRHNAGWLILDSFIKRLNLNEPRRKYRGAFWGPERIEGESVAFFKPHTFMNLSGLAVSEAFRYHNLEPHDLVIIYDDVALPFGRMRLREKGSAGGQKGMISILESLGTQAVPRLRFGVDSPRENQDMASWVLGNIPVSQKKYWNEIEDLAWKALTYWLANDIQKAMSYVNGLNSSGLPINAEKK